MATDPTPVASRAQLDPVGTAAAEVARQLDVVPEQGLSSAEAQSRLASHGRNELAAAKKEPGWRAFLRQYEDFMQIVLLVAAAVNLIVTVDVGTSLVLAGLTVFNAVVGLRQESKAEESVKALAQMMKTIARVRRDGQAVEIDAGELVAGRRRPDGGRQPGPGRRPALRGGDPGDRGGGADRREPAGRQVHRPRAGPGRPARATGSAWPT